MAASAARGFRRSLGTGKSLSFVRPTKMKKAKVDAGALYVIPGGSSYALAKIIYASKYFRNVILIRLYERAYRSPEEIEVPKELNPSQLIYTGAGAIKTGGWSYVGEQSVQQKEREMSKRIVGGDVWIEDTHIGPASEQDQRQLKNMQVKGYALVAKAVAGLG